MRDECTVRVKSRRKMMIDRTYVKGEESEKHGDWNEADEANSGADFGETRRSGDG